MFKHNLRMCRSLIGFFDLSFTSFLDLEAFGFAGAFATGCNNNLTKATRQCEILQVMLRNMKILLLLYQISQN